ncbi:alpha-ketoglutarate-dependent dioxygenase AlkB [Hymenobacter sp. BT186]|uniref:Alpha-ketoglutarate-dependent dioxygenase AlkB n=1 Tax=Hymenobacter telluris TaxID=2816474 RepID=A0A939F3V8_9BACT|nr:alpha-ketoglutarate-dependent dioxygenase AlkB [Hymenobacter telluris]MBO0360908.1 alpha-ketoglutarate-dependent dioxygenase AlkB [Hymenobacter telluris]MBW3376937.1 alpha-ketoglutarate-dependent dioxygenase AlkB [Hymenobacter norwichensis]
MSLTPVPLPQAEVLLDPTFLSPERAAELLAELTTTIPWRHEPIKLFGKEVLQPRLTSWHGDPTARYAYSGLALDPQPWTPALLHLRQQVEAAAQTHFNSVLLNLYRTGQDSMGWHADDEPELGPAPVIASVSLGATRRFRLRPRNPQLIPHAPVSLDLPTGSLLLMRGTTQQHWLHAVPKTARPTEPRLNLTFRLVTGP